MEIGILKTGILNVGTAPFGGGGFCLQWTAAKSSVLTVQDQHSEYQRNTTEYQHSENGALSSGPL